jgi:hypothetical protein
MTILQDTSARNLGNGGAPAGQAHRLPFFGQNHKENSQQAVRLPYNLKT